LVIVFQCNLATERFTPDILLRSMCTGMQWLLLWGSSTCPRHKHGVLAPRAIVVVFFGSVVGQGSSDTARLTAIFWLY
jgi:hypothetical protein